MSNVIGFPCRRGHTGEVIELSEIRAGLNQASAQGIPQSEIQASLNNESPAASQAFRLLNSPDPASRRYGSAALARMTRQSDPTDEPPTAA